MAEKKLKIIIVMLIIFLLASFFMTNFIWVDMQKVKIKPNGEDFIYEKILNQEKLCYIKEMMAIKYDFRINNKGNIQIKRINTMSLKRLEDLIYITSHAEDLKLKSIKTQLGYYCTDFADLHLAIDSSL